MKLTFLAGTAAAAVMAATAAGAATIDFSTFADGTSVSSVGPVGFSLYGGPGGDGAPLVSDYWFGDRIQMNNSSTGNYPTAEGIEITFAGGANNVSFTFNNYGSSGSFEEAYNGVGTQTDFQSIGSNWSCVESFCTVNVAGSDITSLYIDNNTGGEYSWEFGIGSISYNAVPEPASWALMLIGLGALGGALRAGRRRTAVTA